MSLPVTAEMWSAEDPRFGVVRHVLVSGDFAVRLDDLNSDYREIELGLYQRQGDEWRGVGSRDDAGYPEPGAYATFDLERFAGMFGRHQPSAPVTVHCLHGEQRLQTDAEGWWLFVCPVEWRPDQGRSAHSDSYRVTGG
jgi:hypothetical protein